MAFATPLRGVAADDSEYAVHPDILTMMDELFTSDDDGNESYSPPIPIKTLASLYGANPPVSFSETNGDIHRSVVAVGLITVYENYTPVKKHAYMKCCVQLSLLYANVMIKPATMPVHENLAENLPVPTTSTTVPPSAPVMDLEPTPTKPPRTRMTNHQRAILAALAALNFCGYMCYSNIAPFFPQEVLRKGGSATWTGLIFACYQLVMFVLAPIIGRYIEVLGARFLLIAGPFLAAGCCVLFGFLDWVPHGPTFIALAFIIRMFEAVGAIMFVTASMSIRPTLFPNDIAFVYGVLQTFTSIGLAVGPALGGLLYEFGGYGLPFWTMGGLFMALAVLLMFILPEFKQNLAAPSDKQINAWHFLKEYDILLDLLTYSTVAFAAMFYDATISLHIYPLVGHNVAHVGFVMFVVGVAEIFAAPLGGIYQDRGGSSRLVIIFGYVIVLASLIVMGPTPLLPFLQTSLVLVVIGTAFYGIGLGCFFAAPYKEAVEATIKKGYPPNQRTFGVLAGCFQSFFSFGAFIGPAVGGFLQDRIGFRWASTVVAGVVLLLFVAILGHTISRFLQRRNERQRFLTTQVLVVSDSA